MYLSGVSSLFRTYLFTALLSFLVSFNVSASFFSIEKKGYGSVYDLTNAGGVVFKKLSNPSSLPTAAFKKIDNLLSSGSPIKFDYGSKIGQTAKQFLSEKGTKFYDLVLDNGTYAKIDLDNGRMLYVDGDFHAFVRYTDGNNITDIAKIEELLQDRVTKLRNLLGKNGSQSINLVDEVGGAIKTNLNKVSTFIGNAKDHTRHLKDQFGNFRHIEIGETTGSVNLLNMPDTYWKPATWFEDFNQDWMLRAINRGDDIYIATPITRKYLYNPYGGSYYARELNELIKAGIKPKNISQVKWNSLIEEIKIAAKTKY